MELYKELVMKRCFTWEDMIRLSGSENSARWHIQSYLKKGYIQRIRRDLYAVISLETEQTIPNRFQIASSLTSDAFISHHSAFEFYGYGNQVFYEVYFSASSRIKPFTYDGFTYIPVTWKGDEETQLDSNGVRVTSIERTVIDGIADFRKIGGLEEFVRCLILIPELEPSKLLRSLEIHDHSQLYQKAGYILECFKEELMLPESFFDECEKRISNSKTYLFEKQKDFVLHERWKLFAPKNLRSIIDKGVNNHDAI